MDSPLSKWLSTMLSPTPGMARPSQWGPKLVFTSRQINVCSSSCMFIDSNVQLTMYPHIKARVLEVFSCGTSLC